MANSPYLFSHMDACAVRNGVRVQASVIPAVSVLLVARGADQALIPVPHPLDRERAEEGVALLPAERRHLVKFVDQDGDMLLRVREYLTPLRHQADKWPEDAFVGFAEQFLYEVLLAGQHKASILSASASVAREFVPIVDPTTFSGEARFRLAEIARLLCAYKPAVVDSGLYAVETARDPDALAWRILEAAEYHALTAATGAIGFLDRPLVGLCRLRTLFVDLIRSTGAGSALQIVGTAADAAGAAGMGKRLSDTTRDVVPDGFGTFQPPFVSIGPAIHPLYRSTLDVCLPGSTPPPDTLFTFQSVHGGRFSLRWLGSDQAGKLEREAAEGLEPRLKRHRDAQAALGRFV